ncbi:MAG: SUMF1/EgtB/PvdO family nonheme iron enzyme [bacterium]
MSLDDFVKGIRKRTGKIARAIVLSGALYFSGCGSPAPASVDAGRQDAGIEYVDGGNSHDGGSFPDGGPTTDGGVNDGGPAIADGGAPDGNYILNDGGQEDAGLPDGSVSSPDGGAFDDGGLDGSVTNPDSGIDYDAGILKDGGSLDSDGGPLDGNYVGLDGGPAEDGGPLDGNYLPNDGGAPEDGGAFDGGDYLDGGTFPDGGPAADGGSNYADGGAIEDGGAIADGGSLDSDGGPLSDGGSVNPNDGGAIADGGSAIADGGSNYADGGPSADGGSIADGGSGLYDGGPAADGGSAIADGGAIEDGGPIADGGIFEDGGAITDGGDTSDAGVCNDPNSNTFNTAAIIANPGTYTGYQICSGTENWFKTQVSSGESLEAKIDFLNAKGNLDLCLYDSNQTLLGCSTGTGDSETVTSSGTGTDIYIKVYGAQSNTENTYSTTITFTPTPDAGLPADAGIPEDGGADAGVAYDAGIPEDGGPVVDGGVAADGGASEDGGPIADGGAPEDGGPVADGGPEDGGVAVDGGYATLPGMVWALPPENAPITFWMGCPGTGCSGGDTRHQVTLTKAYQIDKTEVTNAAYKACVDASICTPPSNTRSWTHPNYFGNPDFDGYPVIYVDWEQANSYCESVGKQLPTEAQWEYAARGTDERKYPWGASAPVCTNPYNASTDTLNWNLVIGDTSPVENYPLGASPSGALNMSGNVMEWVADWYEAKTSDSETDPQGPDGGTQKVVRGGNWFTRNILAHKNDISTYWRLTGTPTDISIGGGFRCAYVP